MLSFLSIFLTYLFSSIDWSNRRHYLRSMKPHHLCMLADHQYLFSARRMLTHALPPHFLVSPESFHQEFFFAYRKFHIVLLLVKSGNWSIPYCNQAANKVYNIICISSWHIHQLFTKLNNGSFLHNNYNELQNYNQSLLSI
jgi:hypothetical protein